MKKTMTFLIMLLLPFSAFAINSSICTKLSDGQYISTIVNKTWLESTVINLQGQNYVGLTNFYQGGIFRGKVVKQNDMNAVFDNVIGTWAIQNGVLIETITYDDLGLMAGTTARDQLICMSSTEFQAIGEDGPYSSKVL